jgi:hypothetical protein
MRRMLIISALFLVCSGGARADQVVNEMYRDLIRPHGHPRGAAVSQAALDFCYSQTGDIRGLADTAAFKQCMLSRGYRWQKTSVKGKAAPTNGVDDCIAMDMC